MSDSAPCQDDQPNIALPKTTPPNGETSGQDSNQNPAQTEQSEDREGESHADEDQDHDMGLGHSLTLTAVPGQGAPVPSNDEVDTEGSMQSAGDNGDLYVTIEHSYPLPPPTRGFP
ncbi:hypothetical protein M422DRAFT_257289 [Sphaerobolus stellatus SS14]|uniref:Uncharacterized protein n=1 Tax=Sphaerobolus stellatus (strain SS14) TaxID=990650 RepID=A0A0C9UYP2_SPHS4|nr:hypothetical protein M422DRAFT_257289 [Sphaerobolus stellatus SS14]